MRLKSAEPTRVSAISAAGAVRRDSRLVYRQCGLDMNIHEPLREYSERSL